MLYGNRMALSPDKPIPGRASLTKKRELFPGLAPTSPGSFALPHSTPKGPSPCSGSGILTRFPFDRYGRTIARVLRIAPLQNGVLLSLRAD